MIHSACPNRQPHLAFFREREEDMTKGRIEAFSDGVIAIIITIMVLELHPPEGTEWADLWPLWPTALAYVLSFVNVGIYWANHHHMFHAVKHVSAAGCCGPT
jgi:uncharacterized membrane protein